MKHKQVYRIIICATNLFLIWCLYWMGLEYIINGAICPSPIDDMAALPIYVLMIYTFYYKEKYKNKEEE